MQKIKIPDIPYIQNTEKEEKNKRLYILMWCIFGIYSIVTLICALNHEMWFDEAQAVMIIKDCPLSELPYRLKVEGHPPLWYLILFPFVKLGFPTSLLPLVSWFFMAAGVWVLLFKVRLPLLLKILIVFSSGFLFYNSAILRVYCIIPLLMFLILCYYPKRRQCPIIYGILVGLLANTHLFVSGIVAVLGILMLYDMFSQWKDSSKKENVKKLTGLAIAGALVLILIIPLIGSNEANTTIRLSFSFSLGSLFYLPARVAKDFIFQTIFIFYSKNVAFLVTFEILYAGIVLFFIELRHWRRAFAVQLVFTVLYIFFCGVAFITLPNRAAIFGLSLAFSVGLAQYEKPVFKEHKFIDQTSGKIKALLKAVFNADKKAGKYCIITAALLFALSIPAGIRFLWEDIRGNFSGAKDTAKYITENLEKDAVFVAMGVSFPEVIIYDPDIKIFCVECNDFSSYSHWEYRLSPKDKAEAVKKSLEQYDNLYFIKYSYEAVHIDQPLYLSEGMTSYDGKNSIAIYEYDWDIVESFLNGLEKNEEK